MSLERQAHDEHSPWWGEHIHRYNIALTFISSTDKILDIACGNGFGSNLLSKKTNGIVIGGDISPEAISYCSNQFSAQPNLTFQIIDGTNIPFEENYFDCLVSFETIEHTTQYKKMIEELHRIVKSKGIALISTPNIVINTPAGEVLSKFHTQEFTYTELHQLLNDQFSDVQIFGQKYIRYESNSFRKRVGKFFETLFYMRGIRKIPISIQNNAMKLLINKEMYPQPDDFALTSDKEEILRCKTFFAVCRKN